MGSLRKILAIIAMGTSLAAFTALGSADPAGRAAREGGRCPGCGGAVGTCCSGTADRAARGPILLARGNPASPVEATSQKKAEQQAKAGPASMAKGVATRKALLEQVSALMDDGVADCCIEPGCAFCPIAADGCSCAGSLAKGGPVCPECWGGWRAGQGMLPDVKAEKVQVLPRDQLKKLYDMRAEKLGQAEKK